MQKLDLRFISLMSQAAEKGKPHILQYGLLAWPAHGAEQEVRVQKV